ncbi:NAD(P)/FAD-dependent oxidoreductase [Streptomyces sp. LHD-70]|uniref:NAD(P)/FAD-dependent oxidoreductase n=1 Tax=Streptomyces sp. LHD-70 TaxID=3072140 RepID=UPI00280E7618|nr:NAD(P)/FAD-dependent oxidoreductase [Streptomyces sp. LHD-70]MDQ8705976.1 NAD(P)/FAD-dependent oxidoreductase [Streptomyces sp. LHD-70]
MTADTGPDTRSLKPVSVDIAVVGAGPAGLFAAYYAGLRGLRVALLDSLPHPGGQVAALYPEKRIHDIAGLPAVHGRELIDNLLLQVAPFEPEWLLGHTAVSLNRSANGGGWVIGTDQGGDVRCGAVVVTGGVGSFTPRRLPAGDSYEGRGVTYHVARLADHRGQDVVVVGGGDSAVDWALALEPLARSVTLVHRTDRFRAQAHSVDLLRRSSVEVVTGAQVTACHGVERLSAVDVTVTGSEGSPERRDCQAMIAALGFTARLGPIGQWGMALVGNRILVGTDMQTDVPGVFAAGDIATYPGRVPLIAVGFGEAATAVNNAVARVRPDLGAVPGHSSDAVMPPAPQPVPALAAAS